MQSFYFYCFIILFLTIYAVKFYHNCINIFYGDNFLLFIKMFFLTSYAVRVLSQLYKYFYGDNFLLFNKKRVLTIYAVGFANWPPCGRPGAPPRPLSRCFLCKPLYKQTNTTHQKHFSFWFTHPINLFQKTQS
jgi:hypothetical protein